MPKKLNTSEKLLRKRTRYAYANKRRIDMIDYAAMISQEFDAKVDRLSKLIGNAHEPSLGNYKERLIIDYLKRFLPGKYAVGTGFIVFPKKRHLKTNDFDKYDEFDRLDLKTLDVSQQLDVIIFDNFNHSPLFQDGDFVVLKPESVRAVIEVKGFLDKADITTTMNDFVSLGKKWHDCEFHYRHRYLWKLDLPNFHLMAWYAYVDQDGRKIKPQDFRDQIAATYKTDELSKMIQSKTFPILTNAYIFGECCIDWAVWIKNGIMNSGYNSSRGKFIKYNDKGKPSLGGDKTLSSLLADVHVSLDVPLNPEFYYLDLNAQSPEISDDTYGFSTVFEGKPNKVFHSPKMKEE